MPESASARFPLKPPVLGLAPLAGYTNLPFRRLVKPLGADLVVSEMISANAIWFKDKRTSKLMRTCPEEQPVALQLFGAEPERMAAAARRATEFGPALLDINAGCSVPKVMRTGAGARLLEDPGRLSEVISAVCEATNLPVTVKLRLGPDPGRPYAGQLVEAARKAGACAVTVHGRYARETYKTPSRQEELARLAREFEGFPLLANGDFWEAEAIVRALEEAPFAGIMLGRPALANPWLFSEAKALLRGEKLPCPADYSMRKTFMLELARALADYDSERGAVLGLRKYASALTRNVPQGAELRARLNQLASLAEFEQLLEAFTGDD